MARWIANHFAQKPVGVGRLERMMNVMYLVTLKNVIMMGGIANIDMPLARGVKT